jgi:curved DNA-binding protein CbpA
MTSHTTENTPLSTLYLQIEYGDTLSAVLGISSTATEVEIRDAYRALVLRIHPDKAPDDGLRKLHTLLFQKVQSFYDAIPTGGSSKSSDSVPDEFKQLPETLAALHARNIAAKEALKQERTRATGVKHAADAREAVKNAKLAARYEKLAGIRNSRAQTQEAQRQKRIAKEAASKLKPKKGRSDDLAKATAVASGSETAVRDSEVQDWEQEEDRLAAREVVRTKVKTGVSEAGAAFDEPVASAEDIKHRWDANLLSGGTSGSVSLSEKEKKGCNAAATAHASLVASIKAADDLHYRNYITRVGNHSAHLFQDALEEASVQQEADIDARVDEALGLLDQDVIEQHLLEDGELERSAPIGSLAIKFK